MVIDQQHLNSNHIDASTNTPKFADICDPCADLKRLQDWTDALMMEDEND